MRKVLVLLSAAALSSAPLTAQTPDDVLHRIREEGMQRSQAMETFQTLTDVFGGRLTGSLAFHEAVDWTSARLEGWGVETRIEPFDFGRGWSLEKLTLEMEAPYYDPLTGHPEAWSPSTEGVLEGVPVYVGDRTTDEIRRAAGRLRGAIVLSEYFATWLRRRLPGLPVLAVRHPTEIPEIRFSPEAWRNGAPRRVVQVGWYGRNVRAIRQVQAPPGMSKLHIIDDKPWIRAAAARVAAHAPTRTRPESGAVETCGYVDNLTYDRLLAESIVLAEYFDVSASNTVVECIARGTPVLVNCLPALEEYLGRDYPLFFHDIETAGRHLADRGRLEAAHHHLVGIDRSWLSARGFARSIEDFLALL